MKLVIALGIAALAVTSTSASSSRIRTCKTAELMIEVRHGAAAAGTAGGYVGFTNRSDRVCRLSGWPTLVALAAGRSRVAVHARSTMFGPRPEIVGVPVVMLRHGQRADAVFTTSDIPGPGQTRCPAYRHLRVTPPGNTRSVVVSAWLAGLAAYLPACTAIEVSFVVRASTLYHG